MAFPIIRIFFFFHSISLMPFYLSLLPACLLVLCGFFFLLFLRQMNASRGNCRGKNNLGLGVAILLQVTDEGIKFHGTWKRHLQHDGVEPGDAVAFQDIGAGCNIRGRIRPFVSGSSVRLINAVM